MTLPVPQQGNQPVAQIPDYIRNRQLGGRRRMVDVLSENLGFGSPPYLSIAGSAFTLKSPAGDKKVGWFDPNVGVYLDMIIIDLNDHVSKIFYLDAYTPGASEYKPPDCFSHNGTGPSVQSSNPQSSTCPACPWFAWGSAISEFSGKPVKACLDYQQMAVVIPGESGTWLLRVPPASLKNLSKYKESFRAWPDTDIRDVITRIWFDPNKVGCLIFSAPDYAPPELIQYSDGILARNETDAVVGRTDIARSPALALPNVPQQPEQGQQAWPQSQNTQQPIYPPAAGAVDPAPSGGTGFVPGAVGTSLTPITPAASPSQPQLPQHPQQGYTPSTPQGQPQMPPAQPTQPAGKGAGRPRNRRVTAQPQPNGGQPAQAPFRPQPPQQAPQAAPAAPQAAPSAMQAPQSVQGGPGQGYQPAPMAPQHVPAQPTQGAPHGMATPSPVTAAVSSAIDGVIGGQPQR